MSDKPENMMPDPEELPEDEELDLTEEPEQIWPPPAGPPEEVGEVRPKRDAELPDAGWTQEVRKIDEAIDEIRRINDQLPEEEAGAVVGGHEEDIELDIAELDRQVGALADAGEEGREGGPSGERSWEGEPPGEPADQSRVSDDPAGRAMTGPAQAGEPARPEAAVPAAELEETLPDLEEAEPAEAKPVAWPEEEAPEEALFEEVTPTWDGGREGEPFGERSWEGEPPGEPARQSALADRPPAQEPRPPAVVPEMVAGVVEAPRRVEQPSPGRVVQATCRIRDKSEAELGQLWGNVFFSADRSAPRAVIVTAAQRRDGATQIATSLAMIGAEAGRDRRVALVDFNLRNPAVADVLGMAGEPGLTDVLEGRCPLEAAMHTLALKNGNELHVLPSGMAVDKPLGLLKSRQVQSLIGLLQSRYDHTIIDVAAANVFPDAQVIGALVDGALLVVRAGYTPRETVAEAKKRLVLAGVKCLGVVLNQQTHPVPGFVYRRT